MSNDISADNLSDMEGFEEFDRRIGDRQMSVLINARVEHGGNDALCRIRNVSAGGVMIESDLVLVVDDPVHLHLRSGRTIGGRIRWTEPGRAGIAFDDSNAAQLVTERLTSSSLGSSSIGFPLFEREAWAELSVDRKRCRAKIVKLSATGICVTGDEGVNDERVMMVAIDGLGQHLARRVDDPRAAARDEISLMFVQPLHYRALNAWLAAMPRMAAGEQAPEGMANIRPLS